MRAEGPSLGRRLPGVDLQRHAHRGRETAGRLHGRLSGEEPLAGNCRLPSPACGRGAGGEGEREPFLGTAAHDNAGTLISANLR